jgi:hypothetical protein
MVLGIQVLVCRKEQEKFEDTKGVIRSRKSKKNRQHIGRQEYVDFLNPPYYNGQRQYYIGIQEYEDFL